MCVQASVLSNCRIESNYFSPNRNALLYTPPENININIDKSNQFRKGGILVPKNHFSFSFYIVPRRFHLVLVFSKHFYFSFHTVQMQSFLLLFYLVHETF